MNFIRSTCSSQRFFILLHHMHGIRRPTVCNWRSAFNSWKYAVNSQRVAKKFGGTCIFKAASNNSQSACLGSAAHKYQAPFISLFNQLDAQNLFHNKFYFMPLHVSSTCAHRQEVKITLHSLWYHHTVTSECPKITKIQFYNWIKIDQLDVTCFIISLFTAQHVSNVSTFIFRSLRLIVDLSHGFIAL